MENNRFNQLCAELLGFEKYPIKGKKDGYIVNFNDGSVPYNSSIGSLDFHLDLNKLDKVLNRIEELGFSTKITGGRTWSGNWKSYIFTINRDKFTFEDTTYIKYESKYGENENRLSTVVNGLKLFFIKYYEL